MKGSDATFGVEGKIFEEKENEEDFSRIGIPAYTHLDLDVKVYLKRLQEIYGVKIIITNGWVSQEYNQKTLKRDNDNPHLSGLVVDIKMDEAFKTPQVASEIGQDWLDVFTRNAKTSGFLGVVVYDNHIHLDIREIPR